MKSLPKISFKKNFIYKFLLTLTILTLTGCCREDCYMCPALSPGCCNLPAKCCCLEKDPNLINRLRSQGVQVERMGDKVLVLLSSNTIFYSKSPHLNPDAYPMICDVITFLNCFEKMEIKVAAYTDNCGCVSENLALTKNQATNLVS